MQRMACVYSLGVFLWAGGQAAADDQPAQPARQNTVITKYQPAKSRSPVLAERAPIELVARTYPVADLITPVAAVQFPAVNLDQPQKPVPPRFQFLIEHLRRLTGAEAWRDKETSFRFFETTLSLVVRQAPEVHRQIAEELSRMRRESDLQIVLELMIVTGSRGELADLVAAYAGELGRAEKEELTKTVQESVTLNPIASPKITMFNRQTASVETAGKLLTSHAVITEDRRSLRLKMGSARDGKLPELVSTCQIFQVRAGRSVAVHFEAERVLPGLAPAEDAEELLVIVTPRIIVPEEEEAFIGTVQPRIIIQEEEEELLGIPTNDEE